MKIVICGSMSAAKEMVSAANELLKKNHEITLPRNTEKYAEGLMTGEQIAHEAAKNKIEHDLIRDYFRKIENCDAILVVNAEKKGIANYIGGNGFLEMGFAHVLNKKIFILNDIPQSGYTDEIVAMQPVVLKGDLEKME